MDMLNTLANYALDGTPESLSTLENESMGRAGTFQPVLSIK